MKDIQPLLDHLEVVLEAQGRDDYYIAVELAFLKEQYERLSISDPKLAETLINEVDKLLPERSPS